MRLDEDVLYDVVHVPRTPDQLEHERRHVGRVLTENVLEAQRQRRVRLRFRLRRGRASHAPRNLGRTLVVLRAARLVSRTAA